MPARLPVKCSFPDHSIPWVGTCSPKGIMARSGAYLKGSPEPRYAHQFPHQGEEKWGCAFSSRTTSTWEGPRPLLLAPVGGRGLNDSVREGLSCRIYIVMWRSFLEKLQKKGTGMRAEKMPS